jgi:hypothetical protein
MKKLLFVMIIVASLVPFFPSSNLEASASTGCEFLGEFPLERGWIDGPAMLQPSGEGYVISVFPKEEYFNQEGEGTMWFYEGDVACLQAQYGDFEAYEIIEIVDLYTNSEVISGCSYEGESEIQRGWIQGPSLLQPAGAGYIISIYPSTRYYNQVGEGTMWSYKGDNECLVSQYGEFPEMEIVEVIAEAPPEEYTIFLPLIMRAPNVYLPEDKEGCGFRSDGWNIDVYEGDIVWGPAILVPRGQLSGNNDGYFYAIYPGANFSSPIRAQGWLYYGDSECLESQFDGLNPNWEIIKIKP